MQLAKKNKNSHVLRTMKYNLDESQERNKK